jgi:uncharacterized protein YdeI (YjbR/CyaY-like superfamily)
MPARTLKTFQAKTLAEWRRWLSRHHAAESEVWLIFPKSHSGEPSVSYQDALDEALCFGWVDSLIKRLDAERYARKFTPRKPDSRWSAVNRRHYARLKAAGRLRPSGISRAPTTQNQYPARQPLVRTPAFIRQAIDAEPKARAYFDSLAPSYKRLYVGWIASAKKEETRLRRLDEAVRLLKSGQTLGLK